MAKTVRYLKQGGPEVLQFDDLRVGDPGQGQVHIRHTAIGGKAIGKSIAREARAPALRDVLLVVRA